MKTNRRKTKTNRGFTLIELLVVIVMIGILSAIAAPSWLSFVSNQKMGSAQTEIFLAMRKAQSAARKDKIPQFIAAIENSSQFYSAAVLPGRSLRSADANAYETADCDKFIWKRLEDPITIRKAGLPANVGKCSGIFRVSFDKDGNLSKDATSVGFRLEHPQLSTSRCIRVTTQVGSIQSFTVPKTSGCEFSASK